MTGATTPRGHAQAMREAFDRSFARRPPEPAPETHSYIAIRAARRRHALPLADIAGLFADKPVTRLPSREPAFLGLAGFGGTIAPVYDLQQLLGHAPTERPAWLVVARATPVAFAFEGFDGHLRVARDDIVADENSGEGEPLLQSVRLHGGAVPVVRLPAIIGTIGRLMSTA